MKLSDTQYRILSELYHEFNEAFMSLDNEILLAFYDKLFQGEKK